MSARAARLQRTGGRGRRQTAEREAGADGRRQSKQLLIRDSRANDGALLLLPTAYCSCLLPSAPASCPFACARILRALRMMVSSSPRTNGRERRSQPWDFGKPDGLTSPKEVYSR